MSDMGEMFSGMREASQERRASNRENSATILIERGVSFESKNFGAHLIVKHGDTVADFWPGTGKYNIRGTKAYRRGVFNLLRDLGVPSEREGGAA